MYHIMWQRYLMRKYVYIIICIMFLILLILWNSTPSPITTGSQFQDQQYGEVSKPIVTRPTHTMKLIKWKISDNDQLGGTTNLFQPNNENELENRMVKFSSKVKGNSVSLTIYMESQCPDTTGFIKRQLIPTFEKLKAAGRVNYTIVPFGKAHCEQKDGDFICDCQHGISECHLNQLMNCAIDKLPLANDFVPIIGCVQGQSDLKTAFQNCLHGHPDSEWLWTCSNSKRGRYLHALAGERTARLGTEFNFVPWVVINEKRVNDAFYALEENLCKRLDAPKPIQCEHFV